jgi:hypothetical protein
VVASGRPSHPRRSRRDGFWRVEGSPPRAWIPHCAKPDCSRIVRILANKRRYSRRNIGEEVREGREDDARGVGGTLPEEAPTLDMVTFASYEVEELGAYMGEERKRLGEPSWTPLDRGSVEALVGEPLDQ